MLGRAWPPAAYHGWTAADTIASTQENTVTAPGPAPPSGTTTDAWSISSIVGIDTATNHMRIRSRSAARTPATARPYQTAATLAAPLMWP
ncbi:hypothetical protein SAMN04489712_1482 [Thermomonospora echinospora]|uniref:Uncharacterized protein n=1 Tax=Thermomonospora echinospora TaxID=1992 RepID=A0A1H6E9T3_9ACTN|nr:hypothetical protein [Thermomonospora echinospora]SEG94477.1 hypothetical protein SAMN04489712_1482 [Thermomonospora echinospora]